MIEVEELIRKGTVVPYVIDKRRQELVLQYLRDHDTCPQCRTEYIRKMLIRKSME
jgi:hypothetical protein